MRFKPLLLLVLCAFLVFISCSSDSSDDNNVDGDVDTESEKGEGSTVAPTTILETKVDEAVKLPALEEDVAVAWDSFGMPHIYAKNDHDAAVAIGWVQASMRMFEMEMLRSLSTGKMTELISSLDNLIGADLYYKMIFSTAKGEDLLQGIYDKSSEETKTFLDAYSAGINARIDQYRVDDSDYPEFLTFGMIALEPSDMRYWEPKDTLAIGRLQSWDLARTHSYEITLTKLFETLGEDLFNEVISSKPSVLKSIIPSWNGTIKSRLPVFGTPRGKEFISQLDAVLEKEKMLEKYRWFNYSDASNSWAIGPQNGNKTAYLANDPHLSLQSPPVFMPISIDTWQMSGKEDGFHMGGVAFPGIPVAIIGRNAHVAWSETNTGFDVSDVYEETITYDSNNEPKSVLFNGQQVDVIKRKVTLKNGHSENPTTSDHYIYYVPHHGPLLPETLKPGESDKAFSLRWTGLEPTREIDAVSKLQKVKNLDEAFEAISLFEVGGQNFVFATKDGDIGYFPHSLLPIRKGDLTANPPWMVMPGTGEYEWDGYIPKDKYPQMKNPTEGYILTANNCPTGSTLDGNPLNDDYYYLYLAAEGYRFGAIELGVKEILGQSSFTWEDISKLQNSYKSLYATEMTAIILSKVNDIKDQLSDDAKAMMKLLEDWDHQMLSGLKDPLKPAESALSDDTKVLDSSRAATYFNHLMVRLQKETFGDELAKANVGGLPSSHDTRLMVNMMKAWDKGTENKLFDNIDTTDKTETAIDILKVSIETAVQDVLKHNEFSNLDEIAWGRLHTLTFEHMMSMLVASWNVGPFSMGGGDFTINVGPFRTGMNPDSQTYNYTHGPSMRMIHEATADGLTTHFTLPGGVNERQDSDHFLDLFHEYRKGNSTVLSIKWDLVKNDVKKMTALYPGAK